MATVDEALEGVLSLVGPLPHEDIPLDQALGRVLTSDVVAPFDQPPFAASAMDGYAVIAQDVRPGASFKVIGEAVAGKAFSGSVHSGEAVRIFTGAPVPQGADRVVIQEDVSAQGDSITLGQNLDHAEYIRPAGQDFRAGDRLTANRQMRPADMALAAAMGAGQVRVARRPVVAILSTGDELVMPGETPGADQIVASNAFGLKPFFQEAGAEVRHLPIARDSADSLRQALLLAEGADLLVTTGGASVGDHDLVRPVAAELGLDLSFYKVAMRPGKPLMAGTVLGMPMIGLPGNPVSSMVCGHVFVLPALRKMLGLEPEAPVISRPLAHDLPKPNGPRAHYMRGSLGEDGVTIGSRQDSGLLSVLQQANVLAIRPPYDSPRSKGDMIDLLRI